MTDPSSQLTATKGGWIKNVKQISPGIIRFGTSKFKWVKTEAYRLTQCNEQLDLQITLPRVAVRIMQMAIIQQ